MVRGLLTTLGILAALTWAVLFVRAPGLALELLLLTSPIVTTAWLIMMLTAPRRRTARRPEHHAFAPPTDVRERVLRRDGGVCALCRAPSATTVAARRPAGTDPLDRYISLCDGCAATASLRTVEA